MPRSQATFAGARQSDFTSKVDGLRYRVQIATPFAPPPPGGYPVLYVLDGGGYFGSFAESARLRSALGGEIEPAVVAAIGYPGAEMAEALRRRYHNLSPTPQDEASVALDRAMMGEVEGGGADAFLRIIETEVKPRVAKALPVDRSRSVLFGHSLGGLFALHTLFTRPETFATYLALSPSIWWNHRVVLKGEGAFARQVEAGRIAPRVFIGVGGLEQDPPTAPAGGLTLEEITERMASSRMVDNAAELAGRLAALGGAEGYQVKYQCFEGQTHTNVPWSALNAMLDFALPPREANR